MLPIGRGDSGILANFGIAPRQINVEPENGLLSPKAVASEGGFWDPGKSAGSAE